MKNNSIFIIAEMACSHDGSFNKAKKIIDAAYSSKANAIQLQIWKIEYMMNPKRKDYEEIKKIELSYEIWTKLVNYSKEKYPNLKIYVCVYEHKSIDFIKKLNCDGIKVNTADLTNPLLLKKVSLLKKPINLSIGGSNLEEIEYSIKFIKKANRNASINLLYGIQNFPTKIDDLKFGIFQILIKKYNYRIGYQDHTEGGSSDLNWITALSIGEGVSIIEKHLTVERKKTKFDYQSALNKNEFKNYVLFLRKIEKLEKNENIFSFSKSEKKYRKFQKKSIVAIKNLNKNDVLKVDDIAFLRTDINGISPHLYKKIINKKLKINKKKYQVINYNDLK